MRIEFTRRAQIALDQLPPNERRAALRFLNKLEHAETLSDLRGGLHKLRVEAEMPLFVARLSQRYRAVLALREGVATILEILDHDRISKTYGISGDAI